MARTLQLSLYFFKNHSLHELVTRLSDLPKFPSVYSNFLLSPQPLKSLHPSLNSRRHRHICSLPPYLHYCCRPYLLLPHRPLYSTKQTTLLPSFHPCKPPLASMEKPYQLFYHGENDSITALDDLLLCTERHNDNAWPFKGDMLSPSQHQLDDHRLDDKPIPDESLAGIPYLHDVSTVKQQPALLQNTLHPNSPDTHLNPTDMSTCVQTRPIKPSPPSDKSTSSLANGSGAQSTLSIGGTGSESEQNAGQHYCSSESEKSLDFSTKQFSDKLRDVPSKFAIYADDMRYTDSHASPARREVQKPPTTAGIGLEDLKAVFHLERPKAERKLRLKRTTFSNLSRHYGISKWPFRTIRDARNRMKANAGSLSNRSLSKERRRKLMEQQRLLDGVIKLIYSDPRESRDSNTLAVLLRIVAARENRSRYSEL